MSSLAVKGELSRYEAQLPLASKADLKGRIDTLEKRMAMLEARVLGGHSERSAPNRYEKDRNSTPSDAHDRASTPGMDLSETPSNRTHEIEVSEVQQDADKLNAHKINETIYEVVIVVGLPVINWASSILAVFAFSLAVAIQGLFVYIIWSAFLVLQLPSVTSIAKWRVTEGHHLNNMGVDGTSLVSKVCASDPALTLSTDKISLKTSLANYTEGGKGSILALMVLVIWLVTVAQEVEQATSFLVGVCSQKVSGRTRIDRTPDGAIIMKSLSRGRRACMIVVSVTRIGLAGALCVEGALWLSVQINVVDLVLNAAALAFILDLDDILFRVFVTFPMKVLVAEMEALPKKRSHWHGPAFWPVLNMLLVAAFVTFLAFREILPQREAMLQVIETMCKEPKSWVYNVHDTGIVLAAATRSFDAGGSSGLVEDLQKVIQTGENMPDARIEQILGASGTVQVLQSVSQVQSYFKSTASVLSHTFAQQVAGNGCTDYDFIAADAIPVARATLWRATGNASLTTCSQVRPYCDGDLFITRMICPETCGCATPRSGLFKAGGDRGCPTDICRQSPPWTQALATMPCNDSIAPLMSPVDRAGWVRFWHYWNNTYTALFPSRAAEFSMLAGGFQLYGCGAGAMLGEATLVGFCTPTVTVGSIADFCPVLCNCAVRRYPNCPSTC